MNKREKFDPAKNLDDLPPELVDELNLLNEEERQILDVFKEGGGILNVSEVLVGLYKMYGKVKDRQKIGNRLYRMGQKGLLMSAEKKGEYKLPD